MIEQILSPHITYVLGWTILHALWQGAGFALLLGLLLVLLRRFSPQSRYLVATGLLTAFLFSAGATFTKLYSVDDSTISSSSAVFTSDTNAAEEITTEGLVDISSILNDSLNDPARSDAIEVSISERMGIYFDDHLPLVVTLWLLGVLILQLRFLGQLAYVQRLKHYGVSRFPVEWAATIQQLEEKIGVTRHVQYLVSQRANSPLTVGWLKPVVLFPPEILDELRRSEIISILAHELAHIRRHDYLVGIVQSLITTLFFFHPGVWWMNARIREEREHCCDDLAIGATGGRIGYARALVELQARQLSNAPALTMAADGVRVTSLTTRIHRLVGGAFTGATFYEGITTGLILCIAGYLSLFPAHLPSISTPTGSSTVHESITADNLPLSTSAASAAPTVTSIGSTDPDKIADPLSDETMVPPTPASPAAMSVVSRDTVRGNAELDLLLLAIQEGRQNTVTLFLERGVDVNGQTVDGRTPLLVAVKGRRTEMIKLLLAKGANPNLSGSAGWSPLMWATSDRYTTGMVLLLDRGADADYTNKDGRTAAQEAVKQNCGNCLDLLRKAGGSTVAADFVLAMEELDLPRIDELLKQGANPNQLLDGHPALGTAAEEGNLEAVKLLLTAGADIDLRDHHNKSALELAIANDHASVTEHLLNAGASTEMVEEDCRCNNEEGQSTNGNDRGDSPGYTSAAQLGAATLETFDQTSGEWPSWAGMVKAANILADQNITSMVYPFRRGRDQVIYYYTSAPEVLRSVRSHSADPLIAKIKVRADLNEGGTRITYTIDTKKVDLSQITFLSELGPRQVNTYTVSNWTALMDATERGYTIAVRLLLDAGADPSITNSAGKTALDLAKESGDAEMINLLR